VYSSYSWEDKYLKYVCHDPVSKSLQLFDFEEHHSTADGCLIVIRRRSRAGESQSIARNHAIIRTLQTEVEGRLRARPGVYDGMEFFIYVLQFGIQIRCSRGKTVISPFTSSSIFSLLSQYVVPMSKDAQVEGALTCRVCGSFAQSTLSTYHSNPLH
jgi:hypothetical protein